MSSESIKAPLLTRDPRNSRQELVSLHGYQIIISARRSEKIKNINESKGNIE